MFYKIEYEKRKIDVILTINETKYKYVIYDFDYKEIVKQDENYDKSLFYIKDEREDSYYKDLLSYANKDYKLYVLGILDANYGVEIIEYLLLSDNNKKFGKVRSLNGENILVELKKELKKQCLESHSKNNNTIEIEINDDNINISKLSIIQYIFSIIAEIIYGKKISIFDTNKDALYNYCEQTNEVSYFDDNEEEIEEEQVLERSGR